MPFLLAEGPAPTGRLRPGAFAGNQRVERLTAAGRSVVRQFGLAAGAVRAGSPARLCSRTA